MSYEMQIPPINRSPSGTALAATFSLDLRSLIGKVKDSFYTRLAFYVAKNNQLSSDFAAMSHDRLQVLKKSIRADGEKQANATGWQGWIALGTATPTLLAAALCLTGRAGKAADAVLRFGSAIGDASGKFLDSGPQGTITRSGTSQNLSSKEYDHKIQQVQGDTSKTNANEALQGFGQVYNTASSSR